MNITKCISLCDCMKEEDFIQGTNVMNQIPRIYIGSYFCSNFFLSLNPKKLDKVYQYCLLHEVHVTLVIPIITQKQFESMKSKVNEFKHLFGNCMDEIVVNDYGTLSFLSQTYSGSIHLGRLFSKDYRDPRYEEYVEMTCKPRIFTNEFEILVKRFRIRGIEFDPICRCLDLTDAIPGLIYSVHTPYCYITTGQICEYASMKEPVESKFRPNDTCRMECTNVQTTYQLQEGNEWYRYGKTIYFRNDGCEIKGVDRIRMIQSKMIQLGQTIEQAE